MVLGNFWGYWGKMPDLHRGYSIIGCAVADGLLVLLAKMQSFPVNSLIFRPGVDVRGKKWRKIGVCWVMGARNVDFVWESSYVVCGGPDDITTPPDKINRPKWDDLFWFNSKFVFVTLILVFRHSILWKLVFPTNQ